MVGELVTITGEGFGADESVTLGSHVSNFTINVSDGEYGYSLEDFNLSEQNTNFSLCVRAVEDNMTVNIRTSLGLVYTINNYSSNKYGIVFYYDAANKTATVYSTESLPVGSYKQIEISGTAVDNETEVNASFDVTTIVTANETGYFETVIDTHGIPTGEYTITADGVEERLTLCRLVVHPDSVMVGVPVTITGEGFGADESVALSSHVSNFTVPVSAGEYEYSLDNFNLPDTNTSFSLSVQKVEDNMTVKITKSPGLVYTINNYSSNKYGIVFYYDAANKTATVYSTESLPVGSYKQIEISGTAVDNETEVNASFDVTTIVTAKDTGYFETVIDTHGFPPLNYTIHATSITASAYAILKVITATGSINVTSSPPYASVYLDNAYRGITPLKIPDVPTGTYTIELTLKGYDDWSANVSVMAGETSYVNATLTESTPTPGRGGGGGGGGSAGPSDADGDGYCNIKEIIMGTDPEDPCDPDPKCIACQASGTYAPMPVPVSTPRRPTAVVKYLQTPTPRPSPTATATATHKPKPLLPISGPDKPFILIAVIIAVVVLIGILFFLHRKFKSPHTKDSKENSEKIVWR